MEGGSTFNLIYLCSSLLLYLTVLHTCVPHYTTISSAYLQQHLLPQPPRAKLVSSSDVLVVEDNSQRMILCGNIPSSEMVTGEKELQWNV